MQEEHEKYDTLDGKPPWRPKPRHESHKDAERSPTGLFLPVPWEQKQAVLDRIANGERLTDICRDIDRHPKTVRGWFKVDAEALDAYIDSKEQCLMKWCEEILDIADGKGEYADKKVSERNQMINVRQWSIEKFSKSIERLRETKEQNNVNLNAQRGTRLVVEFANPVKTEKDIKEIEDAEVTDV